MCYNNNSNVTYKIKIMIQLFAKLRLMCESNVVEVDVERIELIHVIARWLCVPTPPPLHHCHHHAGAD